MGLGHVYKVAGFGIESCENPDDGDRDILQKVSLVEPIGTAISRRTFY